MKKKDTVKIKVEFIPLKDMRYETLGDYFWDRDDVLHFQIANTGNPTYDWLILIHELIEEFLTRTKGLDEIEIFKYDNQHQKCDEPGDEIDSPYRDEHSICTAIERILLAHLGRSWKKYEQDLEALMSDA